MSKAPSPAAEPPVPQSDWGAADVAALTDDIVTLCTTQRYNRIPWPSMESALLKAIHEIRMLAQNGMPLVGKQRPEIEPTKTGAS